MNNQDNLNKQNHILCAETVAGLLSIQGIKADVKGCYDDGGDWIEISLIDPTLKQLQSVADIRNQFEVKIQAERKDRQPKAKKNNQVDYVAVHVKYTKDFKNKVWNWIQSKFSNDVGSLPKSYEELDQYHVGKLTKVSAFKMIDYAIFNRYKDFSFWNEFTCK